MPGSARREESWGLFAHGTISAHIQVRRGDGCEGMPTAFLRHHGGKLRMHCEAVTVHPLFDQFIMLCILVNCIFLAMADPTTDKVPMYEEIVSVPL